MRRHRWFAGVVLTSGCVASDVPSDTDGVGAPRARRTVVLGVDGLRPDALREAVTPSFDVWAPAATVVWDARTQTTTETSSGPGWSAILTGVEPVRTGVLDNDAVQGNDHRRPSMLLRAHEAGLRVGLAAHWIGIPVLVEAEAVDERFVGEDAAVGETAAGWILDDRADVVFLHLDDVDHAGHATGFGTDFPGYVAAVEGADTHLAPVFDAIAARDDVDWLVILTTDHGGDGANGHGARNPACETIPLAMSAPGVAMAPGSRPDHLDVAPTVAAWHALEPVETDGESWIPRK